LNQIVAGTPFEQQSTVLTGLRRNDTSATPPLPLKQRPRQLVFAEQVVMPRSAKDRAEMVRMLTDLARRSPNWEVLIKPRIAPGEATFHQATDHISTTVLESVGQLPSNMRLDYRPLPELLRQARLMATVSSTAFFDALDFGCRPLAIADFGLNPSNGSHVFAGSGVWRSLDEASDLDSLDQELPQPDEDWLTWMGYGQNGTPEDLILALQELKRNKRQEIKLERGYMSNTSLSFTQLRRDAERAIQAKQWKEAHSLLTLARVMRPSHRNVARRLKAVEQPNQLLRRLLLVLTYRDVR
jgi:hypothetical protein